MLPNTAPSHLRCHVGPYVKGKKFAKAISALQCIRALHIDGELDDHLQSIIALNGVMHQTEERAFADDAVDPKEHEKHLVSNAGNIPIEVKVVADALTIKPTPSCRFGELYLYTTKVSSGDSEEFNLLESCVGMAAPNNSCDNNTIRLL